MDSPVAVYVHIPFCPSKCGYCDFNSYAMSGEIVERTVQAIIKEIEGSLWQGRTAKTIFFGGGTPTFLSEEQLTAVLEAVIKAHPPVQGAEITSEANPGTVDASKFMAMREAGFNRISLGAQSFQREDLMRLGRVHQESEIGKAVGAARRAGFDNLNLDLMFALPGQSLMAWEKNLSLAFMLEPDHLSLYCLTIEPNTRFYKLNHRGMLDLPDDECQVAMYDLAVSLASSSGFKQYEISNFAKPGCESRHNLCYWRCEEYLAYGPGAVGCYQSGPLPLSRWNRDRGRVGVGVEAAPNVKNFHPLTPSSSGCTNHPPQEEGEHCERTRYTNFKHPERYCQAIEAGNGHWCDSETLDEATMRLERIMMGIRLSEGISALGLGSEAVDRLVDRGWLESDGNRAKLTRSGNHFCTEVAMELA